MKTLKDVLTPKTDDQGTPGTVYAYKGNINEGLNYLCVSLNTTPGERPTVGWIQMSLNCDGYVRFNPVVVGPGTVKKGYYEPVHSFGKGMIVVSNGS